MQQQDHPWLVRNTAPGPGRHITITPETSPFQYISAGRILLDKTVPEITATNDGAETTLLVLSGSGEIVVDGTSYQVTRFDGVYVPRGLTFTVRTDERIDIFEGSAPTEVEAEVAHVEFSAVKEDPDLALEVGTEPAYRDIYKVLADNIDGGKLLTGVTLSKPGNWTSWPPHEHAATQEELYLFFDMPHPAVATQYVYSDLANPEFVRPVYGDDAVIIVKGYHPNVAAPGFRCNFAWLLCSLEDRTWRKVGGVNVQPEYEMDTGLK